MKPLGNKLEENESHERMILINKRYYYFLDMEELIDKYFIELFRNMEYSFQNSGGEKS
jgi:hypothetical protein